MMMKVTTLSTLFLEGTIKLKAVAVVVAVQGWRSKDAVLFFFVVVVVVVAAAATAAASSKALEPQNIMATRFPHPKSSTLPHHLALLRRHVERTFVVVAVLVPWSFV